MDVFPTTSLETLSGHHLPMRQIIVAFCYLKKMTITGELVGTRCDGEA